jgi:hypothetical protein
MENDVGVSLLDKYLYSQQRVVVADELAFSFPCALVALVCVAVLTPTWHAVTPLAQATCHVGMHVVGPFFRPCDANDAATFVRGREGTSHDGRETSNRTVTGKVDMGRHPTVSLGKPMIDSFPALGVGIRGQCSEYDGMGYLRCH